MVAPAQRRSALWTHGFLIGLLLAAAPASANAGPKGRLIHCGDATCLSIAGYRPDAAMTVRIAGNDLAVEGGRSWRAAVPLANARDWASARGDRLTVTLVDPTNGAESSQLVMLPPGALGRRIELASLIVSAH